MEWWLLLLPVVLSIAASIGVRSAYHKYGQIRNQRGLTGAETARRILDLNGLQHVQVEPVGGQLSDHFDPRSNVVRLSEGVYDKASIAALAVAAHECGHAVQHAKGYVPVKLRTALVPVTNLCSHLWYITFLMGLFFSQRGFGTLLITIGILLFAGVALFQLVTLPVEFNASSRAMTILREDGFLAGDEVKGAGAVLRAAAMTYVAGLLGSLMQLLRLMLIAKRRR